MKRLRQHVTFKSIAGIVLLLVLFSTIVSIIGYRTFTNALLDQYAEGAFLTAQTAAELVDADRLDEYAQSGGIWTFGTGWTICATPPGPPSSM